jgi:hypothetical protein
LAVFSVVKMRDYMEDKNKVSKWDAIRNSMLSGGLSGSVLGGVGRALSGTRKPWEIATAAGLGGLVNAGLVGGSVGVGSALMGEPGEEDSSGYTKRAATGGALAGGAAGAGLGALGAKGKLAEWLEKSKYGPKIAEKLPIDNIIVDNLKKFIMEESPMMEKIKLGSPLRRGLALGALLGGTVGAAQAGGEGMQVDVMAQEIAKQQRRARLEQEMRDNMERLGYGA